MQGVAASVLAYCDTPEEVQWLAATAAVPAVALCLSPNNYTSQVSGRRIEAGKTFGRGKIAQGTVAGYRH